MNRTLFALKKGTGCNMIDNIQVTKYRVVTI